MPIESIISAGATTSLAGAWCVMKRVIDGMV